MEPTDGRSLVFATDARRLYRGFASPADEQLSIGIEEGISIWDLTEARSLINLCNGTPVRCGDED